METEAELVTEYQAWLDSQGLPQLSADELFCEDLTAEQRKYVSAFIDRWETVMKREHDRS